MPVLMRWWVKMEVQWKGAATDALRLVHRDSSSRCRTATLLEQEFCCENEVSVLSCFGKRGLP